MQQPVGYRRLILKPQTKPQSLGWYEAEKDILRAAIAKFGSGYYQSMLAQNILPFKTTRQLYAQAQRLLNMQAIGSLHGINLDVEKTRAYFDTYFRTSKFHRRDLGEHLANEEKEALTTFYRSKFQLPPAAIEETVVSYYLRLKDPEHQKLYLAEVQAVNTQGMEFSKACWVDLETLKLELQRQEKVKMKTVGSFLPTLDILVQSMTFQPMIWKAINNLFLQLHNQRSDDLDRYKDL